MPAMPPDLPDLLVFPQRKFMSLLQTGLLFAGALLLISVNHQTKEGWKMCGEM